MNRAVWTLLLLAAPATAADHTPRKEPAYRTAAPRYGLLVFGPAKADRVWLVHDGDTLHVDRNGNGDLTDPGEAVAATVEKGRDPKEFGYSFEVGDLSVGGKVHKGLRAGFTPLKLYADNPALGHNPFIRAALKDDPAAVVASVSVDVASDGRKGGGLGGRVSYSAGFYDLTGVLRFAARPADAPVIHLDGPWEVTFYGERPVLRLNRDNNLYLVVGTPGHGPGTFAMVAYDGTVPKEFAPTVEAAFPPARKGEPPVKQLFELKERC